MSDQTSAVTHNPLPWSVFGRGDQSVADCNGDGVAWCAAGNDPVSAANAAFIVTACNSHHDLLAALKAADVLLAAVCIGTDNGCELIGPTVRDVMEVAADVSEAIAKAETQG